MATELQTAVPIRRRRRRRGSILLMMLVLIVVLSALIVQFVEKGMGEIVVENHYAQRERLRLTAYSGLETTLAVLADIIAVDGGLTTPGQGWSDPLGLAGFEPGEGVTVKVSFVDESGKLPLNELDETTLTLLFSEMGFTADEALGLAEKLLDWIDADDEQRIDGAEFDIYGEAEWPYRASNQAVRRLSELALVDRFREVFFDEFGRPNDYFRTFANVVSFHSSGTLNPNSASDLALRAYATFGDPQIDALRSYLAGADGVPGNEDDRFFLDDGEIAQRLGGLPEGVPLTTAISALRVRVAVDDGSGQFAIEAVVQPGQAGGGNNAAPPNNNNNQQQQQAVGSTRRTGVANASAQVTYPFVFLELEEDVGQNATIAAPLEEPPASADGVARK